MLTVGRIGVDLYPEQTGVPLSAVTTFARSLGGTATNVAVGATRLGHRAAVLTKVGPDEFGTYARQALEGFGVDTTYVGTAEELLTPVVFCALDPPEDPPLLFYRLPVAPDLTLTKDDVPWDLVRDVPVLWVTGTGVSTEPARQTQLDMLAHRGRPDAADGRWTVLDLDWRPMFWPSPQDARREYELMLEHVTVVVGNRAEVEVAVGTADPEEAARRLLDHGVELALVKKGAEGCSSPPVRDASTVAPQLVDVVCGLGAGDAFGGRWCTVCSRAGTRCGSPSTATPAGAIVVAQLACADAMPTIEELEAMVAGRWVAP